MHVVSVDTHLLLNGLQLYQARPDKAWSLTACISFIVMQEQDLVGAVTSDDHFRQAGFRAVLLEVP
jgi:predicted nucleic acid-binding protein